MSEKNQERVMGGNRVNESVAPTGRESVQCVPAWRAGLPEMNSQCEATGTPKGSLQEGKMGQLEFLRDAETSGCKVPGQEVGSGRTLLVCQSWGKLKHADLSLACHN